MILKVKVKPNARKTKILKQNGELEIAVAAPAESGKANAELIRFLEKKFGKPNLSKAQMGPAKQKVSLGDVKIIRGKTNKRKIIELT